MTFRRCIFKNCQNLSGVIRAGELGITRGKREIRLIFSLGLRVEEFHKKLLKTLNEMDADVQPENLNNDKGTFCKVGDSQNIKAQCHYDYDTYSPSGLEPIRIEHVSQNEAEPIRFPPVLQYNILLFEV